MCAPVILFVKQKTAYEVRISDWSSDVYSADLQAQTSRSLSGTPGGVHDKLREVCAWRTLRLVDSGASGILYPSVRRPGDRKSVMKGKRVSECVDVGGRRICKQ